MINAMIYETNLTATINNQEAVETIYFGGGTPSLLTIQEVEKLLNAVYKNYKVAENAEITLEANPDDITKERLTEWKSAGINRFSVGIQSFNDLDLKWMNRVHNAKQAMECLHLLTASGFNNYSIDLIYGTPGLSDNQWKENILIAVKNNVPHIACYALTVEPQTALHKMISSKKKDAVDPEKQADQFLLLMETLQENNYEHYEISNFAKAGYRSKHNSSYWQGKPYVGIGPSAHSFNKNVRRWNVSNNSLYIKLIDGDRKYFEEEMLTNNDIMNEQIMICLRTSEGLHLVSFEKKFGVENSETLKKGAQKHLAKQHLIIDGNFLKLTTNGKLFADAIASDLFFI